MGSTPAVLCGCSFFPGRPPKPVTTGASREQAATSAEKGGGARRSWASGGLLSWGRCAERRPGGIAQFPQTVVAATDELARHGQGRALAAEAVAHGYVVPVVG